MNGVQLIDEYLATLTDEERVQLYMVNEKKELAEMLVKRENAIDIANELLDIQKEIIALYDKT